MLRAKVYHNPTKPESQAYRRTGKCETHGTTSSEMLGINDEGWLFRCAFTGHAFTCLPATGVTEWGDQPGSKPNPEYYRRKYRGRK